MIQKAFAENAAAILAKDDNVIGLAAGGSWLTNELDEFSDLDLILVTSYHISNDKTSMLSYAGRLGNLLSAFTGEHVGEPRVLICLYDDPLLHVDIKFLTIDEFHSRVEDPHILIDRAGELRSVIKTSPGIFPQPDLQWIEDRFWTWVHYALLKIGRGELLEAFDFLSFLRMTVLGPLAHVRSGNLPRGVRKVETSLEKEDRDKLLATVGEYSGEGILESLENAVKFYRELREEHHVHKNFNAEQKVMLYFDKIKNGHFQ